jgi:phosphoenolpyruvate-protein kinase (PTS system EI component)
MKSLFEVINIDLAQEYTKERKLAKLESIATEVGPTLEAEAKEAVAAMDIPESDERFHWIQKLGRAMGADLLTIGKVQPENMIAAAALDVEDFQEAVKVAVKGANDLNQYTVAAERAIAQDTISEKIV